MARSNKHSVNRRNFLRGAVAGTATLIASTDAAHALEGSAPPAERDSSAEVLTEGRSGSDFMVDVIKYLGFDYICANPADTVRGLHESIINYGNNQSPEFITCCHEELSVSMANGYFKIEGKPLLISAHGTVGLQHASMAIYNAYCDRAPVYIIIGNILDASYREAGGDWNHSAQDAAATVRDYLKWDDTPVSLPHFAESAVRA
ncbi:MAG: thiamine pyrophosphate-binding protein, partial [Terriglobia bacterium]